MVTLTESLRQVKVAEESVTAREREIQRAEEQARRLGTGGGIVAQLSAGSAKAFQRRRKVAKKTRKEILEETRRARKELKSFSERVSEQRIRIERVQAREAEIKRLESDVKVARDLARRGIPIPGSVSGRVRQLAELERERLKEPEFQLLEGFAPSSLIGGGTGFSPIGGGEVFQPVGSTERGVLLQSLGEVPQPQPRLQQLSITPLVREIDTPKQETISDFGEKTSTDLTLLPPAQEGRFGGIQVTAADTSLGTFLERRNPVTGTLRFVAEKARGRFGREEERVTPFGQSLAAGVTGERVSIGVQTAPFVIPQTAPAVLLATGVGQFTPGGLREAEDISVGLEERFGLPKKAVKSGVLGLSAVGAVVGGAGVLRQTEAALGLPKFDVKFLAQQQPSQQIIAAGDETFISTRGVAEVTRKGLISERKAITAFESLGKLTPQEEGFLFQSATRGASREFRGIQAPTGKQVFGRPSGFGTLTSGAGRDVEQSLLLDLPSIGGRATRGVEGFEFIGSTRLFRGPGGVSDFERFVTVGKGFQLPSGVVTRSQIAPLEKTFRLSTEEVTRLGRTGRADVFGLTRRAEDISEGTGTLILKTRRGRTAGALSEQSIRESLAVSFPRRPIQDLSTSLTGVRSVTRGTARAISDFPSIVQVGGIGRGRFTGLGTFERTSGGLLPPTTTTRTIPGSQLPGFRDLQIGRLGIGSGLLPRQRQVQRQRQSLRELSSLAPALAQQPRQRFGQRQTQRQIQLQRQTQKQQFRIPSPTDFTFPTGPIVFGGLGLPLIGGRREKRKKPKRKRRRISTRLGVGFTASVLDITGEFPTPKAGGLGLLPSQLRVIPRRRT